MLTLKKIGTGLSPVPMLTKPQKLPGLVGDALADLLNNIGYFNKVLVA